MKLLTIIFFGVMAIQTSNAQKIEFRLGSGYHFSSSPQYFIDNIANSYNNLSNKKVDASLGRGFNFSIGASYPLKTWLGISMEVYYNKTLPAVKGSYRFDAVDYFYREENKWNSQTVSIAPLWLFKVPGQKLNPYSKFGFVIPLYSKVKVTGNYQSSGLGTSTHTGENTKIFRLRNTIGYTASIGIAPQSKKRISFFAEISLLSQSIKTKRSSVTSDKNNGVETIGTYTVYSKETIYVNNLDNQNYDPNKPSKALSFSLPYSSIGLNAGFSIKL